MDDENSGLPLEYSNGQPGDYDGFHVSPPINKHQEHTGSDVPHSSSAHSGLSLGTGDGGWEDFVLPPLVHIGQELDLLSANADIVLWHHQHHDDTCAIVCQEFILESVTGLNYSENELMREAYENGWYTPGGGTPMEHVGDLLSAHGISIERGVDHSISDLETKLHEGEKVIVGVNAEDVWYPHTPSLLESLLTDIGFMPGQQADHAVQVVSIDRTNPSNPIVLLNDSGTPDGAGERVPLSTFEHAWSASDHFMVTTLQS